MAIEQTLRIRDEMSPIFKRVVKSINDTMHAMALLDGSSTMQKAVRNVEKLYAQFDDVTAEINGGVNPAVMKTVKHLEDLDDEMNDIGSSLSNASKKTGDWRMTVMGLNQGLQLAKTIMDKISKVTGIADTLALTKARLDLMNDGQQTTAELQDKIYRSAQRSRGEFNATADAVAKMGILAGDAFGSNDEIIGFMEQINKNFAIAGTETQGQAAAMLQLTQAMGAGVLRGEELNSIFEQAPTIIQSIASYLDVPIGKIRTMASEGQITSEIVKNAMLSTADETNAKFETMPQTFASVATSIKNQALMMFQPALAKLSELANSPAFQTLITVGMTALSVIAEFALGLSNMLMGSLEFIAQYAHLIEPIMIGLLAGLTAYFVMTNAQAVATTIKLGIQTLATWSAAAATQGLTLAQYALNAALNANPLMWIATLIGIVVAAVIHLWRTNMDFKYGFLNIWDTIVYAFEMYLLIFRTVAYGIANAFDSMWLGIVSGAEWGVNGVISAINFLIEKLNKIPGVNIEAMDTVAWSASVQAANDAKRNARQADIDNTLASVEAKRAERTANRAAQRAEEEARIAENANGGGVANSTMNELNIGSGIPINGGKLDSVGKIDNDVTIDEEDLKMLRDYAQMEYINQFTTLRPEMRVVIENVNETADVNGVLDDFARQLQTAIEENLN